LFLTEPDANERWSKGGGKQKITGRGRG